MFSFFKRSKEENKNSQEFQEFGLKQMRRAADKKIADTAQNAVAYMSDGSGYLYVSMLVYICRAGKNMNKNQREIIIDLIRRYSKDNECPDEDIENQLKRWITPTRQQYAVDVNKIVEDGAVEIMEDLLCTSRLLLVDIKDVDSLQNNAIEKMESKFNLKVVT
jgi:hypothetical protein